MRLAADRKRQCPNPLCHSNKWTRLGAVPTTLEELRKHLVVRYRCEKCGTEFAAEEAKGVKLVDSAAQCVHCGSRHIERTSDPDADMALFRCRQCHGWMGLERR